MRLRPRLALTAAALAVPLALIVSWVEAQARARATGELLASIVGFRLAGDGRARCEESPERWSRPLPPPPPGVFPPPGGLSPPPGALSAPPGAVAAPGWAPSAPPGVLSAPGGVLSPPPFGLPPPPFPLSPEGGPLPPPPPGLPAPGLPPPPPEEGLPPGAPPPPLDVVLFPFDETLRPSLAATPPLDRALVDALEAGASSARGTYDEADGRVGDQVLVRASSSGSSSGASSGSSSQARCAFVLARRLRPPLGLRLVPMMVRSWGPPLLAMVLAIVLGLAPLVRRIRALAAAVRASARQRYREPIAMRGDDEIAELGAEFDHAAREVREHLEAQERREQTLRDFLANTTHDVMTPLTVLQGHLSALAREAREGKAVDGAIVAAAIDESHYMASLVHNLGVAARLEAGEPHLVRAPVDLGALAARVVGRHRPIARQHEVALEVAVPDAPLVVDGDETFLEQAVSNVVDNAIRYQRAGGHVAVILEPLGAARFRLRVLDDGPGVADVDLARIAERSVRGEAGRTRNPDGRGLGLAIARKVATLHAMELVFARSEFGGLQVDLEGALRPPPA